MGFNEAYQDFIKFHIQKRKGERLRRLKERHGHAEQLFIEVVWWPAFGHFNHLHPEYEYMILKTGSGIWILLLFRPSFRVAVEIDGFGPHLRNSNRWQFSDQWQRQNHLVIDGWRILRFSYDDMKEKPRYCQQIIQQLMGRWLGEENPVDKASCMEKEVIRLALRLCRPVKPTDVCEHLGVESKYARKLLAMLVDKRWVLPASGSARVRSYKLNIEGKNIEL